MTSCFCLFGSAFVGPNIVATLYDLSRLAFTTIGSIDFNRVGAIAFDNSGTATSLFGISSATQDLLAIDPFTGAGTSIATISSAEFDLFFDMSFRPSDNVLFAWSASMLDGFVHLVTIDLLGNLTDLGPSLPFSAGFALAFDGNGVNPTLFGSALVPATPSVDLFLVNQSNGAVTNLGTLAFLGFPPPTFSFRLNAMTWECSSNFFLASVIDAQPTGGGGAVANYVGRLNINSLSVINLGTTVQGLDAVAI